MFNLKATVGALMSFFFIIAPASRAAKIELEASNFVVLRGYINEQVISGTIRSLNNHPKDEIYLFIDSPGGEVDSGLELVTFLKHTPKEITCIVKRAISMAFAITQACKKRLIVEDGLMMQHVMSYSLEGRAPNNNSLAGLIQKLEDYLDKMQADRMGVSLEFFQKKSRDDWWMFPGKDAVETGAVDEVADVTCHPSLFKKQIVSRGMSIFGPVEVVWSGCPLISIPLAVNTNFSDAAKSASSEEVSNALDEVLDMLIPIRMVPTGPQQRKRK